jgi:hypothetical protein
MNDTSLSKTCTKCHETKPIDKFTRDPYYKNGYKTWCKKCSSKVASQWQKNNKDNMAIYHREWAKNNVEKRRASKQEWDRKHRLDPTHRLSNNIRTSMYHALSGKKGYHKWEVLVGYSLQDLINHIQSKLTPDMTWENYGEIWQIDHITPKSWFKYQTSEEPEFKKCWALDNLQPKLKIDNIKKGNRFVG